MKNTELRIGNYVTFTDETNTIVAISPADFAREFHKGYHFDGYEPIPLTEDWLVRFGFECEEQEATGIALYNEWSIGRFCLLTDGTEGWAKDSYAKTFLDEPNVEVKHVHQLQNLFYCLCSEELTTK